MHKSRWILQTLILSIALNATLLCIFFYFLIRSNPLHFAYKPKEEIFNTPLPVTSTLLNRLNSFSFEQLIDLLNDQRTVHQGYKIRDFALGTLFIHQDFDVERGLGKGKLATRKWENEGKKFLLFPGLVDEDFEVLQQFARTQKWPLTAKGFFRLIREKGIEKTDPALISAFCHTPHFVLTETLFARSKLPIQKKTLLALALESGWETLDAFYRREQENADFGVEARTAFLMEAIEQKSKTAAYLLLITDGDFAKNTLEDVKVIKILALLTVKTEEAERFAQEMAHSLRGDEVKRAAILRLSHYSGHSPEEIAKNFYEKPGLKELRPQFRQKPAASLDPNTHIIQPGESLWLIARKYHVSAERLIELNHLQNTNLKPGRSLKIPPRA